ncbi:MAG TPA: cytochrome c [Thermoanaerobaculia bacterium]|nr:cytochrome c [Thermoanaerobaculia bacterium]
MRKTIIVSLAALIVLAALPALAGGAPDGASIFKSKCAMCHGADGKKVNKAMNVQDLTSPAVQKKSDEELQKITADGKGKMPAYKTKLSAEEIKAVVAHIRALAK